MISPSARFFCLTTIIIVFLGVVTTASPPQDVYIPGKHYIDAINSVATTWKAGENFGPKTTLKFVIGLLGSRGVKPRSSKNRDELFTDNANVPREFDARIRWPNCTNIGKVYDQGNCGNCWAFSTTTAFADRLCIVTGGKFNQMRSVEELTFCCRRCGYGCEGGYPKEAWEYFTRQGVVTGGKYQSNEGCQPYRVKPCGGNNTCSGETEKNHKCSRECYGNKTINYRNDHQRTNSAYDVPANKMQTEIMKNGSMETSFDVHDDFMYYKGGVYKKTPNAEYLGGHSVKCIGWGIENNTAYWLMVNSWNESWGDNGLFKILRGENECNVESSCTAGEVKV